MNNPRYVLVLAKANVRQSVRVKRPSERKRQHEQASTDYPSKRQARSPTSRDGRCCHHLRRWRRGGARRLGEADRLPLTDGNHQTGKAHGQSLTTHQGLRATGLTR